MIIYIATDILLWALKSSNKVWNMEIITEKLCCFYTIFNQHLHDYLWSIHSEGSLHSIGIPVKKMRRLWNSLIFIIGNPTPVKQRILVNRPPWCCYFSGGVMSFDKVLLFGRAYTFGLAIACFLAIILMLRLLSLNKYIAILSSTMKICW